MKKIFLLSLLLLFLAAEAAAATKLEGLKVFTDDKGEILEFKFNFDQAFTGDVKTSFFEKSVQVDLTGVRIQPNDRSFSVSDEYIKSVRALQYQKDVVRLRFNLVKNDINLQEAFRHIGSGNEITFFLNKSKISVPQQSNVPVAEEKISEMVSAEEPLKNEDLDDNISNIVSMMSESPATGVAFAAEPAEKQEQPVSAMPDIYSSAMKMIFYLGIILGALYLVLKLLKKKGVGTTKTIFGKEKNIRVLERTFIDNKKSLAIAEICGEFMVIGIGENNINFMGKLKGEQKAKFLASREEKPELTISAPAPVQTPVQPIQRESAASKPLQNLRKQFMTQVRTLLKGKKHEEGFMELLAKKFGSYDEPKNEIPKVKAKPEAKEEKRSIIAEINHEKEEEDARKMLELLKRKAVEAQQPQMTVQQQAPVPAPKVEARKEEKNDAETIAQNYFSKKSQLKFV